LHQDDKAALQAWAAGMLTVLLHKELNTGINPPPGPDPSVIQFQLAGARFELQITCLGRLEELL
jgi:hypothetical protein